MKYIAVLLLITLASVWASNDGKCRALILSGAGSQGAYQAAVLEGLANYHPNADTELAWDVVAGVSAGSLNAVALGGFRPDQVTEGTDFVYALWNSIPDYRAYGNWPFGIVQGIFQKQGIFDFQPGKDWVTEQWGDKTVNRKVSFATTDANNADYVVYEYEPTGTLPSDYIESAFASSSIPAFFEPTLRDGKTLVDGGVIWNIDITTGVRRCRELVSDDSDIIIDMVVVGDHDIESIENLLRFSVLEHFSRQREIAGFYNYMSDYRSAVQMFPKVNFRYFIHPSESLPGGMLPLDFSRSAVDGCFAVGKKDAQNAVKLGPGVTGEIMLEFAERRRVGENVRLHDMIQERLAQMEKTTIASE